MQGTGAPQVVPQPPAAPVAAQALPVARGAPDPRAEALKRVQSCIEKVKAQMKAQARREAAGNAAPLDSQDSQWFASPIRGLSFDEFKSMMRNWAMDLVCAWAWISSKVHRSPT
jgi:hypothetical protein